MGQAKRLRSTRTEQDQRIVQEYIEEHNTTDVDPDQLTAWAINTGRVQEVPSDFFRETRKRFTKAMRDEHYIDPEGREVRKRLPIRIKGEKKQKSIWIELLDSKPNKVGLALSQQRRGILSWVRRHKDTRDSYNDNNAFGAQLPLFDYNFNKDLTEEEMPTEYPDHAPEEDEDSPDFD